MGHERRIGANSPAAGRPQTADPAGGEGGFRLGGNSGRGRMTAATGMKPTSPGY